jgi:hypothetical protein
MPGELVTHLGAVIATNCGESAALRRARRVVVLMVTLLGATPPWPQRPIADAPGMARRHQLRCPRGPDHGCAVLPFFNQGSVFAICGHGLCQPEL